MNVQESEWLAGGFVGYMAPTKPEMMGALARQQKQE